MSDGCEHNTLDIGSAINERSGPDGTWREAQLSIRCSDCGDRFSWRGMTSGISNPHEPVVSADGYELRAPIVDAPGGYVKLLQMAGKADLRGPDGPVTEIPE